MNLETICELILNDILLNEPFERKIDGAYQIELKSLNTILKTIFSYASQNGYSFSVDRTCYDGCVITIFSKDNTNFQYINLQYNLDKNQISYKIKSKIYNFRNNILRAIKIIPFIGPDGAGKTTLSTSVFDQNDENIILKRWKKIVRRGVVYNLTYPLNVMILKAKGLKKGKNELDDTNPKLVVFTGLTYYPYMVFTTIFRKKIIIIDRFFQDVLLENISFIHIPTKLRKNWKIFLKFIPRTFWHIQVDAKNEIILSREQQLSDDDIDKYREYNFLFYLQKPAVVYTYINTQNSIENSKKILLSIAKDNNILK